MSDVFSNLAATVTAPAPAPSESASSKKAAAIFENLNTPARLMKAIWSTRGFLTVEVAGAAVPVVKAEVIQILRGCDPDAAPPFSLTLNPVQKNEPLGFRGAKLTAYAAPKKAKAPKKADPAPAAE